MKLIPKLLIIISLFFSQVSKAQTDSAEKQYSHFKLSLNYNSGLNYYGRTDSLKSSGFFPLAEFWFSKDFYINAAPVFVNNKVQQFDYAGTVTTLGYLHTTDKWITNLYILKPFYKKNSQLVQSALQAQTGAGFSFLNKIINITAGADAKFSDKVDFGTTAGVDHIIRTQMADISALIFDPALYVYAGTQNFTNTYYKKKTDFLLFPGNTQQVNESVQKFNILAYEFSVPIIYAKNKWMVLLTPSYIMPQNLVSVPNRPDLSERGTNLFYATVGLKRSF